MSSNEPRINYYAVAPKSAQALSRFSYAAGASLPLRLRELVNLRISQINGCAFCIDMHAAALAKQGVPAWHLYALAGWREAHRFFSALERATLAWVEAVNAIPGRGPSDAEFHKMRKHFDDIQIAHITLAVGAIHVFNMMNVSMQTPLPETPFVKEGMTEARAGRRARARYLTMPFRLRPWGFAGPAGQPTACQGVRADSTRPARLPGRVFNFGIYAPRRQRIQTIWHTYKGFWATRIAAQRKFIQESDGGNS